MDSGGNSGGDSDRDNDRDGHSHTMNDDHPDLPQPPPAKRKRTDNDNDNDDHNDTTNNESSSSNSNTTIDISISNTEGNPSSSSSSAQQQQQQLQRQQQQHHHRPSTSSSSSSIPSAPISIEPSIFRLKPVDDLLRVVADFIHKHISENPSHATSQIEIEAKLGVLIDKETNARIRLPVGNEAIIYNDMNWMRFESNMTAARHAHYNKMLNECVADTQKPQFRGHRISYSHRYEIDDYYPSHGDQKIRVTTDEKTKKIIPGSCISKERIANLDIHLPNAPLDYRISISIETQAPPPPSNIQSMRSRRKDRISYQHQFVSVDLTQVKTLHGAPTSETTHELEVELTDMKALMNEKLKLDQRQESRYLDIINVFLNNIRILAKRAL